MSKHYEQFKIVSQQVNIPLNRIEKSYRTIKKYFGIDWFEKHKKDPKIIPDVLGMILLGESIFAAEEIGSPSKLIKYIRGQVSTFDISIPQYQMLRPDPTIPSKCRDDDDLYTCT